MVLQPFKPWKSFAEQVQLLEQRGMVFHDKQQAEKELARIGYYRLSGYWYPFRLSQTGQSRQDNFIVGTQFNHVIALYDFDNAIKLLALEAIQHIEIAMRIQIAYALGKHNPIAHAQSQSFNPKFNHSAWFQNYEKLRNHAKNDFVRHNLQKYGELPVWVACEIWDFGTMSKLYAGMLDRDKDNIESKFNTRMKLKGNHEYLLSSHLHTLNIVRNISAHHSRLWNTKITAPSTKGFKNIEWQWQHLDNQKPFVAFCLMKRMLDVILPKNQANDWGNRFKAALTTFPMNNASVQEVNLDKFGIAEFSKNGQQVTIDLDKWRLWK